jgi:hypothetical protein
MRTQFTVLLDLLAKIATAYGGVSGERMRLARDVDDLEGRIGPVSISDLRVLTDREMLIAQQFVQHELETYEMVLESIVDDLYRAMQAERGNTRGRPGWRPWLRKLDQVGQWAQGLEMRMASWEVTASQVGEIAAARAEIAAIRGMVGELRVDAETEVSQHSWASASQ